MKVSYSQTPKNSSPSCTLKLLRSRSLSRIIEKSKFQRKKLILKQQLKCAKHIFAIQRAKELRASSIKNIFIPKRSAFTLWVNAGLAELTYATEVCFRIVDKQEIQALNLLYRKKDKPTNVLSFPSERPKTIFDAEQLYYLGDIILCAEIIQEEALEQNKTLDAHWAHMVLHALLHLRGYDHISDKEAAIMETLEIQLLEKLGCPNPYEEKIHV